MKHYEELWQAGFFSCTQISAFQWQQNEPLYGWLSEKVNDIWTKHHSATEHSAFKINVFFKFSRFQTTHTEGTHKVWHKNCKIYIKPRHTGLHTSEDRKCVTQNRTWTNHLRSYLTITYCDNKPLWDRLPEEKSGVYELTLRRLMSYMYGAPILDVSRSHTTTQHSQ